MVLFKEQFSPIVQASLLHSLIEQHPSRFSLSNAKKRINSDDNQTEISAGLQSQVLSSQMQTRGLSVPYWLTASTSCHTISVLCTTGISHICIHSWALQHGQLLIITDHWTARRGLCLLERLQLGLQGLLSIQRCVFCFTKLINH